MKINSLDSLCDKDYLLRGRMHFRAAMSTRDVATDGSLIRALVGASRFSLLDFN